MTQAFYDRRGKHSAASQGLNHQRRAGDVNPRAFITTDIAPHHNPEPVTQEAQRPELGQNHWARIRIERKNTAPHHTL